jgi:protein tyrosine/serine phosphatase
MDRAENYPVLIHCKAGLHRTGVLVALYRMEYDGWSAQRAMDELKECGFGETKATRANEYIKQYVLTYRPRDVRPAVALGGRP